MVNQSYLWSPDNKKLVKGRSNFGSPGGGYGGNYTPQNTQHVYSQQPQPDYAMMEISSSGNGSPISGSGRHQSSSNSVSPSPSKSGLFRNTMNCIFKPFKSKSHTHVDLDGQPPSKKHTDWTDNSSPSNAQLLNFAEEQRKQSEYNYKSHRLRQLANFLVRLSNFPLCVLTQIYALLLCAFSFLSGGTVPAIARDYDDRRNLNSEGVEGCLRGIEDRRDTPSTYTPRETGYVDCNLADGKVVEVYRKNLCSVSPVLRDRINQLPCGQGLDLQYYTEEQFDVLLQYARYRRLSVDPKNLQFLLEMENELKINFDGKTMELFQNSLQTGNVLDWYIKTWSLPKCRDLCENIIQAETETVISPKTSDTFEKLSVEQVNRILDKNTLCTPELALFQAVERWIEKETDRRNSIDVVEGKSEHEYEYSPQEQRSFLNFNSLRLGSMTLLEFTGPGGPFHSNLLTETEKHEFLDIFSVRPSLPIAFSSIPRFDSSNCLMTNLINERQMAEELWEPFKPYHDYAMMITVSHPLRMICAVGYCRSKELQPGQNKSVTEEVSIYKIVGNSYSRVMNRSSTFDLESESGGSLQRFTEMKSTEQIILEPHTQYIVSLSLSSAVPMGRVEKSDYILRHALYQDATVTVSSPPSGAAFEDASKKGPINELIFSHF